MVLGIGQPVLLLAVRGLGALGTWRAMVGPTDPLLARRTGPLSLNARFGGWSRSEAVALAPPTLSTRALADVVWAFGGRLDGLARTCPRNPVHAVALSAPMVYALRIGVPLTCCNLGRVLAGVLQRQVTRRRGRSQGRGASRWRGCASQSERQRTFTGAHRLAVRLRVKARCCLSFAKSMGAPYQSGRWWYWGQLQGGKLKVELPGGVAYHFFGKSLGVGFLHVLVGALCTSLVDSGSTPPFGK